MPKEKIGNTWKKIKQSYNAAGVVPRIKCKIAGMVYPAECVDCWFYRKLTVGKYKTRAECKKENVK
jgi:hypothetical protein